MKKFKEFYNENFVTMAAKGIIGKFTGKKLKDTILRKLGLNSRSLGVLTGGKYDSWDKSEQDRFKRLYTSFLKVNKDIRDPDELSFKALEYLDKNGFKSNKENEFYKKGMDIKRFISNLKIKARAKGAYEFLKNTANSQGGNILTILKAIK